MNSTLSLTNDYNHLKNIDNNFIVLDKIFNLEKNISLNKIKLINNEISDKKYLINGYEYCTNIYKILLEDIYEELNRIHKIKKTASLNVIGIKRI